jgi:Ca2+-binding RTX toxin-like protein
MCELCGGWGAAQTEEGESRFSAAWIDPTPVPPAANTTPPSAEVLALTGATQLSRWNVEAPLGTSVIVTYSFNTTKPAYDTSNRPGMTPFTDEQKTYVRQAMDTWAATGGIAFVEVPEATGGQIRFNITDLTGQTNSVGNQVSGFGYFPQYTTTTTGTANNTILRQFYNGIGGDIFLHSGFYANNGPALSPGQRGYGIVLHEIGHALGFKHPFEGTPVINPANDNGSYTVMSYNRSSSSTTLGTVDGDAIRYYYGTSVGTWSFDAVQQIVTRIGSAQGDLMLGTDIKDVLSGGLGDDTLLAGPGADTFNGGDGLDLVSFRTATSGATVNLFFGTGAFAAAGSTFLGIEFVDGSSFGDTLVGDANANRLDGFGSFDLIFGGNGLDTLLGGEGSDSLYGEDGNDDIFGWAGFDSMSGGGGDDRLFGEGDADQIYGDDGNDRAEGGDGSDRLYGWTGADSLFGGAGNDTMWGDDGSDVLGGDDGSDLAFGGLNADTLWGWLGDDSLWAGGGNDAAWGDDGLDSLFGEEGLDTLFGGANDDRLFGWTGNDLLWGGDGNDLLRGEQDNDMLLGETGNDLIFGDDGFDTVYGWTGNDSLYGWTGNDELFGEQGDDSLLGEDGNDMIAGGLGSDTMTGGLGADRFFTAGFEMAAGNVDRITAYDSTDRYFFQTGTPVTYVAFSGGAGIHVVLGGGGLYILDVMGASTAQLQNQTLFF